MRKATIEFGSNKYPGVSGKKMTRRRKKNTGEWQKSLCDLVKAVKNPQQKESAASTKNVQENVR